MTGSISKGLRLGVLIGLLGGLISLTRFGAGLEEDVGLRFLFMLRGARRPPSEVVVVALDEESADSLDLPRDTRKWPRALHARLIQTMRQAGAGIVVFDVAFKDQTPEDSTLAEAIREAGNVVLVESVEQEMLSIRSPADDTPGRGTLVRRIPPAEILARESLAFAPFTLPKVPGAVNRFWTFIDHQENVATLPVVVFHLYVYPVLSDLLHLMDQARRQPQFAGLQKELNQFVSLSRRFEPASIRKGAGFQPDELLSLLGELRQIFEKDGGLSEWMLEELNRMRPADPRHEQRLKALIHLYSDGKNRHLNFYGPPRTIATIPFFRAMSPGSLADVSREGLDLRDKVVFVGASTIASVQQKDGFHTVFSDEKGIYLSGVEILATAFANLLEDRPLRPLGGSSSLFLLLFWGIGLGLLWMRFSAPAAAGLTALVVLGYFRIAYHQFAGAGLWFPLVVPAMVQTSFASGGSLLWRYLAADRERKNMKSAFGLYLPNRMVDRMADSLEEIRSGGELLYGSCLSSDIENYTALSEGMDPGALRGLMNDYYDAVFSPIDQSGGTVIDLRGDAMLAVWADAAPTPDLKRRACEAALNVAEALRTFNERRPSSRIHTRLGLHFGPIFLGNIGGRRHLEYRAVGDIVNATSRIESLNKQLRTRLLVSGELLSGHHDFVARKMGRFVLPGKSVPLEIHELMGRRTEVGESALKLCSDFSRAVDLYGKRRWSEAKEIFMQILREREEDGPSRFYIQLCDQRIALPPAESWDAVICLDKK